MSTTTKEFVKAIMKKFRFYTETMTILSSETHPRLNNLATLLKNTEAIEVVNDIIVKIIAFNKNEILKAIGGNDTFIFVTSEITTELQNIWEQTEKGGKTVFIFTNEEIDEYLATPESSGTLFYRINHGY